MPGVRPCRLPRGQGPGASTPAIIMTPLEGGNEQFPEVLCDLTHALFVTLLVLLKLLQRSASGHTDQALKPQKQVSEDKQV